MKTADISNEDFAEIRKLNPATNRPNTMKRKTTTKPENHVWKDVRRAGVPLVCYETSDPAQTIKTVLQVMNSKAEETPVCVWDTLKGMTGINEAGATLCKDFGATQDTTANFAVCLDMLHVHTQAAKARDNFAKAVFFCHNAHLFIRNEAVIQGVWNLRDAFESIGATLVLLCTTAVIPNELRNDIVTLTDPLPTAEEIGKMARSIASDAAKNGALVNPEEIEKDGIITDTLRGISGFGVRQTFAMSIRKEGVDKDTLWERKRKLVEQTNGLTIYRGKETFADVGGLANAKEIISKTISGKSNISCLVLVDELDKAMSASQTDTSGTTQDQNKVMLSYIQDNEVLGMLELGPPGTGKTVLAKAAANTHGIPLIMLDLGAMKGSLVGESEQNMRAAIQVIHAVSDGRALFIGACNRTENLPPELRRRFNYASLFFDLPDDDERQAMWKIWKEKFEITKEQADRVNDSGYTGAEIKNCCLKAWAMGCTLSDAAKTIVPVSKSAGPMIEALRHSADGKYTSASHEGIYKAAAQTAKPEGGKREMSFDR